ncbi:erythromycin esterase family protein [Actinoplanes sp. NPDC051859]|uniref:erythromycin esterase family protein n=1 Tax=Actinoplanes sp. NPDC051859 TaxID=3363909 RepID=UPI00379A56F7
MTVGARDVVTLLERTPRVLALGEPTHGEETLLDLRNEMFRQFVELGLYRTIAVESDCLAGLIVDDYVTAGVGELDDVVARGFSHEWGAFAGNRELVRWMRGHNEGRAAADQVRFAGFDGPLEISGAASPRQALTALHAYLKDRVEVPCSVHVLDQLIGADERWPDPAAMGDPAKSVGRTGDAVQLRLLADDLAALLDEQRPRLIATSTAQDWERARLYARTATGLLRYHHWMADSSPGRMGRLLAVRDAMMAAHLRALAEREPILVYAHNSHLQRHQSSMRMGGQPVQWWSAGAHLSTELGADYAFLATAVGTITHRGVDVPPPDTLEGVLYARPAQRCLAAVAELAGAALVARESPWFGYAPLDPAYLGQADGVVFVKDAVS